METLKVSSLGFPWKEFLDFFSVVQSFDEQTLKLNSFLQWVAMTYVFTITVGCQCMFLVDHLFTYYLEGNKSRFILGVKSTLYFH